MVISSYSEGTLRYYVKLITITEEQNFWNVPIVSFIITAHLVMIVSICITVKVTQRLFIMHVIEVYFRSNFNVNYDLVNFYVDYRV